MKNEKNYFTAGGGDKPPPPFADKVPVPVLYSIGKSPMIHFVVHQQKLRFAFENMWLPIIEKREEKEKESRRNVPGVLIKQESR
ncbi:MAG: hypothetical protein MRZ74_04675 [Blautia sp.]|nr:hypothetical protein [Blautia sp.]MDY5030541.1 hypothetical protein [Blautia sp.]